MNKDMHKTGWMQPPAPFGGPKLDCQQQKPVKLEKQTKSKSLALALSEKWKRKSRYRCYLAAEDYFFEEPKTQAGNSNHSH